MIIELWVWKSAGKNKNHYTHWRNITTNYRNENNNIPPVNSTFIYKTKAGKELEFAVKQIEFAYYAASKYLAVQLCIKRRAK